MAFPPKYPVTPFLDPKTGMPTEAWHQFLLAIGSSSTVATPVVVTSAPAALPSAPATTSSSVTAFAALSAPQFVALSPGAVVPKFRVRCQIPDGIPPATKLDLYYQTAVSDGTIDPNGWINYGTVGSLTGTPFTPNSLVDVEVLNPPPSPSGKQYFAIYILSNQSETSAPSATSAGLVWPPIGQFLIDPESPSLKAAIDVNGNVTKIRVTTNFAQPMETLPDGLAVMYSMTNLPNQVSILTDGGADLTIDSVVIEASGTITALAGSSVGELVTTSQYSPNNTNLPTVSMYWAQFGASQWRKATGVTATSFLFDPPFDIGPTVGETVNWVEIPWYDDRSVDSADTYGVPGESYKLGCLTNGVDYEVLSWSNVYQDGTGKFHISGCIRGLEGTVPLNAAGLSMHYYPAPGAGTVIVPIPALSFIKAADGTWTGQAEVNISIPAGWSVSLSCATYKTVLGKIIRSNIVPLSYGGAYS